MSEHHDFGTPRNLYEKLIRDSERLCADISGDNLFNFVSTAFHLQHWIKNSPLISSEVMKRILRRIVANSNIKHCKAICRAEEHFSLEVDADNGLMYVGELKLDVHEFVKEILDLYENYFKQKG